MMTSTAHNSQTSTHQSKKASNMQIEEEMPLKVGDNVYVLLTTDHSTCNEIGKIIAITPKKNSNKSILKVQWYITRNSLPKKYSKEQEYFSANELFLTGQVDHVPSRSVNGICQVIPFQQYSDLNEVEEDVYFTRAKYDHSKKRLTPAPEKWPRHCICNKPMNPDLEYVQCDKCDRWYHLSCLNATRAEMAKGEFECPVCIMPKKKVDVEFEMHSDESPEYVYEGLSSRSKKISRESRRQRRSQLIAASSSTGKNWSMADQMFMRFGFNPMLSEDQIDRDLTLLRLTAKEVPSASNHDHYHHKASVKEVHDDFSVGLHDYNTSVETN